jgi:hypothetical protein
LPNIRRIVTRPTGASCSRRNSAKLSLATNLPICDAFLRSCGVHAVQGLCRR